MFSRFDSWTKKCEEYFRNIFDRFVYYDNFFGNLKQWKFLKITGKILLLIELNYSDKDCCQIYQHLAVGKWKRWHFETERRAVYIDSLVLKALIYSALRINSTQVSCARNIIVFVFDQFPPSPTLVCAYSLTFLRFKEKKKLNKSIGCSVFSIRP